MKLTKGTQKHPPITLYPNNSFFAYRPLFLIAFLVLGVAVFGALGYHFLEGWSFFDSLYMTIITVSTVGFGETHILSTQGRILTIILIVFSLMIGGYAFSALAAFVLEGELLQIIQGKKMDKQIARLKNHILVCGGGHTGKCVVEEFIKTQTSFVLIERSTESLQHSLQCGEFPYILGDATEDETLLMAGIEQASGLVACLSEDKDNVFVVLSARSLNSKLRIVARSIEESNAAKMKKAGANDVVSPNTIGGIRMASQILRPTAVSFLDSMLKMHGKTVRIEEFFLENSSFFVGKSLQNTNITEKTGLLVLAVRFPNGDYQFNPKRDYVLKGGDTLFVIASFEELQSLKALSSLSD